MASSAMRIRWNSFQARIYLPVCISMHCGIFILLRKEVRRGVLVSAGRQDTIVLMEGVLLQLWKSLPAPAV